MSFLRYLISLVQFILPKLLITKIVGRLARSQTPWFKNGFIKGFIYWYQVDMSQALNTNPSVYPSFNAFFIRQYKTHLRPITQGHSDIASPADGLLSTFGQIHQQQLLQAKNKTYTLGALLADQSPWVQTFIDGQFATIYLAPHDYHRVHMPYPGTLQEVIYVPGTLFAVNTASSRVIPALFANNERVICIFKTDKGFMAVILVGALNVGSIHLKWQGDITPPRRKTLTVWDHRQHPIALSKGEELGHFKLGSTVIILFSQPSAHWDPHLRKGQLIKFGEKIGGITASTE